MTDGDGYRSSGCQQFEDCRYVH